MLEVDQQKLISTTENTQASAAEADGGTDAGSDAEGNRKSEKMQRFKIYRSIYYVE